MLARARSLHPDLRFAPCTVPQGLAELGRFDLLFSNACLHWIPHHETLLPALAGSLNPGGLLAVQMPLTQRSPFYAALAELIREPRWQSLQEVRLFHNRPPEETYDILVSSFASVEMWETVYEHVLPGRKACSNGTAAAACGPIWIGCRKRSVRPLRRRFSAGSGACSPHGQTAVSCCPCRATSSWRGRRNNKDSPAGGSLRKPKEIRPFRILTSLFPCSIIKSNHTFCQIL